MATVNVAVSEAFTLSESSDLNGADSNRYVQDGFTFTELWDVQSGIFPYYPPFRVNVVPTTYTVSFNGLFGYEEPSSNVRLTFSGEYPLINATLYDVTNRPLNLTTVNGNTVDLITFDVAYNNGTFASISVTSDQTTDINTRGKCHFAWPNTAPIGTHSARFTLWDDQATDIALLSIPTFPITINVRETS